MSSGTDDFSHRCAVLKWKGQLLASSHTVEDLVQQIHRKCDEISNDEFTCATCILILSALLKGGRSESHPERSIGKKSKSSTQSMSCHELVLCWELFCHLLSKISFSMSHSTTFFVLSLVVDFLKSETGKCLVGDVISMFDSGGVLSAVDNKMQEYPQVFQKQQDILVHVLKYLSRGATEENTSELSSNVVKLKKLFIKIMPNSHQYDLQDILSAIKTSCKFIDQKSLSAYSIAKTLSSLLDILDVALKLQYDTREYASEQGELLDAVSTFIDSVGSELIKIMSFPPQRLIDILSESDEELVFAFLKLLEINLRIDVAIQGRVLSPNEFAVKFLEHINQNKMSPCYLFIHFCVYGICLDTSVFIDLLFGQETQSLRYILRITKFIVAYKSSFLAALDDVSLNQLDIVDAESSSVGINLNTGCSLMVAIWAEESGSSLLLSSSSSSSVAAATATHVSEARGRILSWNYKRIEVIRHKQYAQEFSRHVMARFFSDIISRLVSLHSKGLVPFDVQILVSRFTEARAICSSTTSM